jgi:hypothetical protein
MRSMGEGHVLVILTFWRSDTLNVPLYRLRRSPSPCRGGINTGLGEDALNFILPIDLRWGGGSRSGQLRITEGHLRAQSPPPRLRRDPPPHRESMGKMATDRDLVAARQKDYLGSSGEFVTCGASLLGSLAF